MAPSQERGIGKLSYTILTQRNIKGNPILSRKFAFDLPTPGPSAFIFPAPLSTSVPRYKQDCGKVPLWRAISRK